MAQIRHTEKVEQSPVLTREASSLRMDRDENGLCEYQAETQRH